MINNTDKLQVLSKDDLEQIVAGTMPPITVEGSIGWNNHNGSRISVGIVVKL